MYRAALLLIAASFLLAFAACSSDDEATAPTSTNVATSGGDIIICPQVGIVGEATPSSPTPQPSCAPGQNLIAPPGVQGTVSIPPNLPSGLFALTEYLTFSADQQLGPLSIALPLTGDALSGTSPAWYTYADGEWQPMNVVPTIHVSNSAGENGIATGTFDQLPDNLILLAEQ